MTAIPLEKITAAIQPADAHTRKKAAERTAQLVMPTRALGRLHSIAEKLCAISGTLTPGIDRKAVLIMAGDHGVAAEQVSAYPQDVTGAMVATFLAGGAGISAIADQIGATVNVVDMGIIPELDPAALENGHLLHVAKIGAGTANIASGAAMTREQAEKALTTGYERASALLTDGVQILGTGDMGIGNTTPSAAIGAVLTGRTASEIVGRGTGVDDQGLQRKIATVERAIAVNKPDPSDAIDILAKVGGFEIGGIAGCVLAGAYHRRPVVIDGFISTAGALIAHAICPTVRDYLFAGHCSAEAGHRLMLEALDLKPILDLEMRLGEGTGGAIAMGVMDCALRAFTDVMTFEEAGVPGG